jgi:putative ABC transport system permease protein
MARVRLGSDGHPHVTAVGLTRSPMLRPRVRRLFRLAVRRPGRAAAEMDDEIRFHIDMRVAQLVARGWPRDAAQIEAQRLFGSFPEMRHSLHAAARRREEILTMSDKLDALRHDLAYALRQLARAPGLAVAVVATFALGIGANATMFGVIDRLLLRPPAHVRAPEELHRVEVNRTWRDQKFTMTSFSYPSYLDFQNRVPGFASVAMQTYPTPMSLGLGRDARKINGILVSGTYFAALGTSAAIGRAILPSDDVPPNGSPVAVIGHGLWQREFGGGRDVLGKTIALAKHTYTIIGVAPKGFVGTGSQPIDVWVPVTAADGLRFAGKVWATDRTSTWMWVFGRAKPGTSAAALGAQVTAAYRYGELAGRGKVDSTAIGQVTSVLPSRQRTLSPERRVAALLGAVSVLVLLIACANVANLLLVRAFSRRREIAVRLALGISRPRLVRQLVTESVVLALAGGLAALAVVHWGSAFVQNVLLGDFAWPDAPIDGRVLAFTAIATIGVGLLTGLVPALQGSDPHLVRTLREGTRGSGLTRSRTRAVLLLVQAALSVILLIGTGLFVRSLGNVHGVRLGVDVNRLLTATIDLGSVGIDSAAAADYFERAGDAAARVPGVAAVTVADAPPFGDWSFGTDIALPGRDSLPKRDESPYQAFVQPNYFSTVGTQIIAGRAFIDADARPGAAPVVIVSASVGRWLWPGETAVGRCIHLGKKTEPCAEIVGVAEDTHRRSIEEANETLLLYLPLTPIGSAARGRILVVRPTAGEPDALIEPLRRIMQTAVPGVPFANVRPMRTALDAEMRPWELGAAMFAAFGMIALVLSSLGLYSVVAYTVAQRMHEMGVRVALGAQARDLRRLVLAQGLRIAALGVAAGAIIALASGRFIAPMLFHTSTRDPAVYGSVIILLLGVATLASLVPARRAVRADPLAALRAE